MQENVSLIVETLRRIQTEGDDIASNVAIFVADEARNYYIQFAAEHDETPLGRPADALYAEAVGNEVLARADKLGRRQLRQLKSLGWRAPHHSPNFYRTWTATTDEERETIARAVMRTFVNVYGIDPDQLLDAEIMIG